jgi:hypothetical protein
MPAEPAMLDVVLACGLPEAWTAVGSPQTNIPSWHSYGPAGKLSTKSLMQITHSWISIKVASITDAEGYACMTHV